MRVVRGLVGAGEITGVSIPINTKFWSALTLGSQTERTLKGSRQGEDIHRAIHLGVGVANAPSPPPSSSFRQSRKRQRKSHGKFRLLGGFLE